MKTKAFQPLKIIFLPRPDAASLARGNRVSRNPGKTIPFNSQRPTVQNPSHSNTDGMSKIHAGQLTSGGSRVMRVWSLSR